MSLPVYVLVLLAYRRPQSAEAALKYLVLGGAATATCLMGASLLYGSERLARDRRFAQALAADDGLSRGRGRPGRRRLLPQGRDRAVPHLGAGCLRRRERAGDGLHGDDRQGRRAAGGGPALRPHRWRRRCST